MALLDVKNLSFSYGDKILYKNADFKIFKGEHIGLVGQNGTGKTTLLSVVMGFLTPDTGEIKWHKNMRVGYLDQHADIDKNLTIFEYLKTAFNFLFEIESSLNKLYENLSHDTNDDVSEKISDYQNLLSNSGFYEIESTCLKVADGLGIGVFGIDSLLKNLSGGQRAKVILAKLLLENPDILLLDEPTNFLDIKHIDWLSDYLKNFEKSFVVISHDFDFLDKITDCILEIEFNKVQKYTGNFSKFVEAKKIKRESYVSQFGAQQKEIKKLQTYIAKNKARASTAGMARSRVKILEKMEVLSPPKNNLKPRFHLKSSPVSSQKTLIVKNLEIGYNKPLLPKLNFVVNSLEKVVITGFNGIGKSTFLKTIIGQVKPISGNFKFADSTEIAYFEQELVWEDDEMTPLAIILEKFPKLTEQEARKHLAQCAVLAKNVLQKIKTLSGGEQSKVKICILILTKSNCLILDEPTNHLDNDSKEVLKTELLNWKGNLILVSHEESFYKNMMDRIIKISKPT